MQRLLERDWIKQIGVRDLPGRPALFGTTPEFLAYFNLESLADLPPLMEQREFGEIAGDLNITLPPEVLYALESEQEDTQRDMFEEAPYPEDDDPEIPDSGNEPVNEVGVGSTAKAEAMEPDVESP